MPLVIFCRCGNTQFRSLNAPLLLGKVVDKVQMMSQYQMTKDIISSKLAEIEYEYQQYSYYSIVCMLVLRGRGRGPS